MKSDKAILEFTKTVPGYYDEDELENLLRLVRSLPQFAVIVEIGVEYGRSASIFLQCTENYTYLMLIDARTHNIEEGRKATRELLTNFSSDSHKIDLFDNHTSEAASEYWEDMDAESARLGDPPLLIDLLHIDADHTESGVLTDLNCWASKVEKGGYIVFHDYNRRGANDEPVFWDYTRAISLWLAEHDEWIIVSTVNTQLVIQKAA